MSILLFASQKHWHSLRDTLTHLDEIMRSGSPITIKEKDATHRIWKVDQGENIRALQILLKDIPKVYVADGHHRLAAAATLQDTAPQWISALYASADQLRLSAFSRLVIPNQPINSIQLFDALKKLFSVSAITDQKAFQPDRLHRFSLLIRGQWFQLDLKTELHSLQQLPDVTLLQEHVLAPLLGITDPRTDAQLFCDPSEAMADRIVQANETPDAILFLNFPISIHKLMELAESGQKLPPKSSFIEPKIPYGMILNAELFFEKQKLKEEI